MGFFNHSSHAASLNASAAGSMPYQNSPSQLQAKNEFYASHKYGTYGYKPRYDSSGNLSDVVPVPFTYGDDGEINGLGKPIY